MLVDERAPRLPHRGAGGQDREGRHGTADAPDRARASRQEPHADDEQAQTGDREEALGRLLMGLDVFL